MGEIKYTSNAHQHITPLKSTALDISSSAKTVTLGGDTNLPGAQEFAREAVLISQRLKEFAQMVSLDANDALASIAAVKQVDAEAAKTIEGYAERTM